MERVKPLKKFGQNYLIDKNIVQKIVAQFNPKPEDVVIEIGPGQGALTNLLYSLVNKLIAVEIDKRVIDSLKIEFPAVEFINQDFLDLDLSTFAEKRKIRIIGNIPYNITSPIIFKLIEQLESVSDATLMVQFEVAKRICSKPRTKDYGILGVLCNYFAEPRLCFKISPNVFFPKPKVDSAIISLVFKDTSYSGVEDKLFIKVVKAAFGNRRKTLKNSLSNSVLSDVIINRDEFDLSRRAEELDINEFIKLAKLVAAMPKE